MGGAPIGPSRARLNALCVMRHAPCGGCITYVDRPRGHGVMSAPPRHHLLDGSSGCISYWEWGAPDGPPIVLIHATGFHARVWGQTVAHLPLTYRIVSVDMRGHGHSAKNGLLLDWSLVADDVSELMAHLALDAAIGVGHSMGAHCLSQVALAHPGAFARLLLIDPVMLEPGRYAVGVPAPAGVPTAAGVPAPADPQRHPVARRRDHWAGWEAFYQHLQDRHPYALWQPKALEDYCRHGLRPSTDGDGFRLACPPVMEASVYMGAVHSCLYGRLKDITAPVTILRAKGPEPGDDRRMDFAVSPTWPDLHTEFQDAVDVSVPHLSHFIPMQDPALTAHFIQHPGATARQAVAASNKAQGG